MKEVRHRDITGMRFGSLVAIKHSHTEKMGSTSSYNYYRVFWVYQCDCTKIITKPTNNVSRGIGQSCRVCMIKKKRKVRND